MSDENPDVSAPPEKRKTKRRGKKLETATVPAAEPAADADAPAPDSDVAPVPDVPSVSDVPSEIAASEEPSDNGAAPTTEAADETDSKAPVDLKELARIVEALLFAAEEPIAPRELGRASGSDSATVRKLLKELKETYERERRPWDIAEIGNGFRLVSRPEFYPAIQRLKTQTAQRKLTQAALETLALIAYRQPIGRAEIESVRGVGAGPVLRMLLEKKLIQIAGRGTGVGQPLLYGTSEYFLEHFGLRSTQDLPKPGEFKNT
jgi:segregation and condensation protein B